MSATLSSRLNQILPRVSSESFLSSEGIGNEIACYIFDYPATDELQVRAHIIMMMDRLASHHKELGVMHLNLLEVSVAYLEQRGVLEKALQMQTAKDDAAILQALKGPLVAEKLRDFIVAEHKPADYDLVLLSGVGSVWPMLRAHSLLNCLAHRHGEDAPRDVLSRNFRRHDAQAFWADRPKHFQAGHQTLLPSFHFDPQ